MPEFKWTTKTETYDKGLSDEATCRIHRTRLVIAPGVGMVCQVDEYIAPQKGRAEWEIYEHSEHGSDTIKCGRCRTAAAAKAKCEQYVLGRLAQAASKIGMRLVRDA